MAKSIQDIVRQANKRIEKIKEFGMQPITLKSPANIIEKFVEPKGTSREGQIKTWAQVRLEYDGISMREYENAVREFLQGEYGGQTYVKGAFEYYKNNVVNQMTEMGYDDLEINRLEKLSKKDFISAIDYASEMASRDRIEKGDSGSFYQYIIDYLDNKGE